MQIAFSNRFWSENYEPGLQTLYAKLLQGCVENEELLNLAKLRSEAEYQHHLKLANSVTQLQLDPKGFARDDGATFKKAFEAFLRQMETESNQHLHIARSLKDLVITPFSKWSNQHKDRILSSKSVTMKLLQQYKSEFDQVHKAQQRYFNRCRLEEDGLASEKTTSSEELTFGELYSAEESEQTVKQMLEQIEQQTVKLPILGSYSNTVTGEQLCNWLQQHTKANSLGLAELAGQQLLDRGFLRLVGQVGNKFVNSTQFVYQWRPKAYDFAGLQKIETPKTATELYSDLANRFGKQDLSHFSTRELDQKYRKQVAVLDKLRLELEATVFEHMNYLQVCERERLVAFKAVMLDFSACIQNVVPALQAGIDQMLLYHETANVERDLRFFIENYQTGKYDPHVVVYDNYYSSTDGASVFGFDLELRARADKKRVPLIVSTILRSLDMAYPKMENDEVRLGIWKQPISRNLREVQNLRTELQLNPNANSMELERVNPELLVQVLKLYLLELPVSVIQSQLYDILRGIYLKFQSESEEEFRINALQSTLSQMSLSHIATLDAITAQLKRLVTIADAKQEDIIGIANEWGYALCRPKVATQLSIDDVFPSQILIDLVKYRDVVFAEIKRTTSAIRKDSTASIKTRDSQSQPHSSQTSQSSRRGSTAVVRKEIPEHKSEEPHPLSQVVLPSSHLDGKRTEPVKEPGETPLTNVHTKDTPTDTPTDTSTDTPTDGSQTFEDSRTSLSPKLEPSEINVDKLDLVDH